MTILQVDYASEEDGTLKLENMPDPLHPNVEGYRAWATAMEPTIRQLLVEESE